MMNGITKKFPVLLFLLLPFSLQAQIQDYGFKLGVQSVGISNQDSFFPDTDRAIGVNLYGFMETGIFKGISGELSLGYSLRGYSDVLNVTGPDNPEILQKVTARSQFHYLSALYLIKRNFTIDRFNIFAGAGPRAEYLFARTAGTFHIDDILIDDEYQDVSIDDGRADLYDDTAYGLSFVLGLKDLNFLAKNFRIEFRYDTDLSNSMSRYEGRAYNNAFIVSAGIGLK